MAKKLWTQQEAIELCKKIEDVCPPYGCHVALTGGLLYKPGPRKDADIMFYRIRQVDEIDVKGLGKALQKLGFKMARVHGWVRKATYQGKDVDFFFPEHVDTGTGEYS